MSRPPPAAAPPPPHEARRATFGVIGLGTIGATVLRGLVAGGARVVGYDRSAAAVGTCRAQTRAQLPGSTGWSVGADPSGLADAEVLVVAVRALARRSAPADLEPLRSAAALLAEMDLSGRAILVESTLPAGTTRRFARSWLGLAPEAATFVAHGPERLSVGDDWRVLRALPHLVGGLDPLSTQVLASAVETFAGRVIPVSSPEVSELSKLLENAFMTVGISLVAEITRVAGGLGSRPQKSVRLRPRCPRATTPSSPAPGSAGTACRAIWSCCGRAAGRLGRRRRFWPEWPRRWRPCQ